MYFNNILGLILISVINIAMMLYSIIYINKATFEE